MRKLVLLMMVILVLPGCFRTRSDIAKEREEDYRIAQDDVQQTQRLDSVEAQVGKIQGDLEEQEHQRSQESKNLRSSLERNEKRLTEVDEKISGLSQRMNLLFEEIKKLKDSAGSSRDTKSNVSSKKNSGGNVSRGVSEFKKKHFDAAAEEFESYLDKYPKGKRSLEASYYLGEIRFKEKDFARAILAYSMVHERAAKSRLGRKSTLRIAESFSALGKKSDAKSFAQLLVQSSPKSAEAKKARRFLK